MSLVAPEKIGEIQTEHAQQVAVFAWAALNFEAHPELKLMFAIPNGGLRNKITAANLKAEGVKAHVPDIFLPVARGSWHGLFIEMKKKGGSVDPGQKDWIEDVRKQGYGACVCVGWLEAVTVIVLYLEWEDSCKVFA